MIDQSKIELEKIPVPGSHGSVKYNDHRVIYDGEVCPYHEMKGPVAKQHLGYEQMKNDLIICSELIRYLEGNHTNNPFISNAVWESIIVKYGRCFVSASEGRGIKLEKSKVFDVASSNIKNMHEHMMNERHNFAAHAGNSDSDVISSRLALMPPKTGKELVMIYSSRDFVISPDDSTIKEIQSLIAHVIKHIDSKLDKIFQKLKDEYESKDIDEIYDNANHIIA